MSKTTKTDVTASYLVPTESSLERVLTKTITKDTNGFYVFYQDECLQQQKLIDICVWLTFPNDDVIEINSTSILAVHAPGIITRNELEILGLTSIRKALTNLVNNTGM